MSTTPPNLLDDIAQRMQALLANTPAADIERNVRAVLNQGFSKLDLATKEEFELQAQLLARTREKLEALEKRVAELEAQLARK